MIDNFKIIDLCLYDIKTSTSNSIDYDDPSIYKARVYKAIGKIIRENRVKNGMSGKDLAIKLKVSQQQISRYERGNNIIDIPRLIYLMTLLEVRPHCLFEEIRNAIISK
ncbi:MAG TPA: hypothetical protein DD649_09775 [Providencia sp.]|uniref:helix-turn-helix domain-containing protein n=1 Tax=Providencia sp. TaxID=589 RepID=UPI000E90D8C5|nr:helix-turn-helix transcriptional regulator [Providencia sp.]MBP6080138.1 helix-turn-helix transcriptional regulator [Providencia sp.]HBO23157.1 hypothetical protein [Providencia sp.]